MGAGGGGELGSEYFCTTMLAAIKVMKAQGWPDASKRGAEEAERPGEVGTTCEPLFQDQAPTPRPAGIPSNRLPQGNEHVC